MSYPLLLRGILDDIGSVPLRGCQTGMCHSHADCSGELPSGLLFRRYTGLTITDADLSGNGLTHLRLLWIDLFYHRD